MHGSLPCFDKKAYVVNSIAILSKIVINSQQYFVFLEQDIKNLEFYLKVIA